jgi:hypothetical protein
MKKEDYNKIKNNPTLLYILTCAYRGRYLVAVSNYNAQVLKEIYEKTFPQKPKPSSNCGQCVYDFCYELGDAYFNYSEKPLMPTVEELKAEVLMKESQPEEPEPEVSEEEMKEVYDSVKADDDEIDLTEKGSKKKAGKKSKK